MVENKTSGFSLIEVAIVVAIVGLLISSSILAYRLSLSMKPIDDTREHFEDIELAMSKFLAIKGRLPCPAKPEMEDDHIDAGAEFCSAVGGCDNDNTYLSGAGICYVEGRDADEDGDALNNKVIMGSVPFKTLGLSVDKSYDGWYAKIKYVVTENLTVTASYDPEMGSIYVVNPLAIGSMDVDGLISPSYRTEPIPDEINGNFPYPFGSGQFFLMSVGENTVNAYVYTSGKGITNRIGAATKCSKGMEESSLHFGLDFENCNNDAYFMSNDRYSISKDQVHWYLDDITHVKFRVEPYEGTEWQYSGMVSPAPEVPLAVKVRKSSARVGIGTDKPSATLDVSGNMKVNKVKTGKICKDGYCFSPELFGGNGALDCSGGAAGAGVLRGIVEGEPVCANAIFTNVNWSVCPPGTSVSGISVGKDIECR